MPLVEIPEFWLIVTPENEAVGSIIGVWQDGSINIATADDALADFFETKRERVSKIKQGYRAYGTDGPGFDKYFAKREPVPLP